jgi:uncharacterized protein with GYD domain
MATFILYGKYSPAVLQQVSAARTQIVLDTIKRQGGTVEGMYATLGEYDLVFILNFADAQQAMKASIALSRQTGIAFTTATAFPVDEFDRMMGTLTL